jgi:PAS domain S-box-containing protein
MEVYSSKPSIPPPPREAVHFPFTRQWDSRPPKGTIRFELMNADAILILDMGGRILWANRHAHDNVGLQPSALVGRNYLEFCPVDTHADLLRLHKQKLEGKSVRFRIDLGRGNVMTVTSGPVRVEDRFYMYVVGRPAQGAPEGDEVFVGMVAAGVVLHEKPHQIDLNSLLIGALKDEAKSLKGQLALAPGSPPPVRVQPWPIRMVIRRLLVEARDSGEKFRVATGGDPRRAWLKVTLPHPLKTRTPEFATCRRIAREQGGTLQVRGRTLQLSFPAA